MAQSPYNQKFTRLVSQQRYPSRTRSGLRTEFNEKEQTPFNQEGQKHIISSPNQVKRRPQSAYVGKKQPVQISSAQICAQIEDPKLLTKIRDDIPSRQLTAFVNLPTNVIHIDWAYSHFFKMHVKKQLQDQIRKSAVAPDTGVLSSSNFDSQKQESEENEETSMAVIPN